MNNTEIPLATTAQFRAAVRRVINIAKHHQTYTDMRTKDRRTKDSPVRYVAFWGLRATKAQIEAIEFVLWASGVTARTRCHGFSVRGTCVLHSKEKKHD